MGQLFGDRMPQFQMSNCTKEEGGIAKKIQYDANLYTVDEENCVLVPIDNKPDLIVNNKIIVGIAVLVLSYFVFKKRK